jgi:hypothetical protein
MPDAVKRGLMNVVVGLGALAAGLALLVAMWAR